MRETYKVPWYKDLHNLMIGVGVIVTAVLFWWSSGWAGIPLSNGTYSCTFDDGSGLPAMYTHEATVSRGEVVEVRRSSIFDGRLVRWTDAKRKDPNTFLVTVSEKGSGGSRLTCTY